VAADARQHGAVPIYVFLPQVTEGDWEEETPETLRLAAAAGFDVIDLSSIYRGQDIATIRVDEYDGHPNRKGHQLVADRLYDLLRAGQLFAPRPVR
jgi:lysophospholipase L1-like esterase